jgi:hypothetical protein
MKRAKRSASKAVQRWHFSWSARYARLRQAPLFSTLRAFQALACQHVS